MKNEAKKLSEIIKGGSGTVSEMDFSSEWIQIGSKIDHFSRKISDRSPDTQQIWIYTKSETVINKTPRMTFTRPHSNNSDNLSNTSETFDSYNDLYAKRLHLAQSTNKMTEFSKKSIWKFLSKNHCRLQNAFSHQKEFLTDFAIFVQPSTYLPFSCCRRMPSLW
jgi:hypothetical protein